MSMAAVKGGGAVNHLLLAKLAEGAEAVANRTVGAFSSYRFQNADDKESVTILADTENQPKKCSNQRKNQRAWRNSSRARKTLKFGNAPIYLQHSNPGLASKIPHSSHTMSNFLTSRSRLMPVYSRRYGSSANSSNTSIARHQIPKFRPSRAQPGDWRLHSLTRNNKLTSTPAMRTISGMRNQMMRDSKCNEQQARDISSLISRDLMPFTQSVKDMINTAPKKRFPNRLLDTNDDPSPQETPAYKFEGWNRPQRDRLMSLEGNESLAGIEDRFERNRMMRNGRSAKYDVKRPGNTTSTTRIQTTITPKTSTAISSAANSSVRENLQGSISQQNGRRVRRTCIPGCSGDTSKPQRRDDMMQESAAKKNENHNEPPLKKHALGQTLTARSFARLETVENPPTLATKRNSTTSFIKSTANTEGSKGHWKGNSTSVRITPTGFQYSGVGVTTNNENRKLTSENANAKVSMTVLLASAVPQPLQLFNTEHYPARRY